MLTFEQKQRLMELLPDFHLMAEPENAAALKGIGVVDAANADEVLAAYDLGLNRREIFYAAPGKERMDEILDKCRIVANSMEELIAINEAAAAFAKGGNLIMVGLRLAAEDFEGKPALGMTTDELRRLVHDIKQLKNISVCGCIVEADLTGLHGKALGKFVRATYRTAKSMTYILPCSMPYICISGLLEAMAENQAEHPETFGEFLTEASVVGMQNTTAFYADYYVM